MWEPDSSPQLCSRLAFPGNIPSWQLRLSEEPRGVHGAFKIRIDRLAPRASVTIQTSLCWVHGQVLNQCLQDSSQTSIYMYRKKHREIRLVGDQKSPKHNLITDFWNSCNDCVYSDMNAFRLDFILGSRNCNSISKFS